MSNTLDEVAVQINKGINTSDPDELEQVVRRSRESLR
jgi:hypothetical protein